MESMEKLALHLKDRMIDLKRYKEEGRKIVAFSGLGYVPEEMIYASGAIPVRHIRGGDPEPIEAVSPYITPYICPFAKAQFGYRVLEEEPRYQMVDMLISGITCQHMRRVADLWDFFTDMDVFRLGVPHAYNTDHGLKYYLEMLYLLKEKLERLTENKITTEKLSEAIDLYNRMRELLKKISLMRKVTPAPISGGDFIRLNHASFYADPVVMMNILESLSQELEEIERETTSSEVPRILLTGCVLAAGDYKVVDLLEENGAAIVVEEFCSGIRHYWENVDNKGDLLKALAVRYLMKRTPCAFTRPSIKKRIDFIQRLIEEFKVEKVIWYQLRNCEIHDLEQYLFSRRMKEIGIPILKLESDYEVEEKGRFNAMIRPFIEVTKGGDSHV